MESLLEVLVRRDGMTVEEAKEVIRDCKWEIAQGADPEEILYELGLEPDYVFDLLEGV